MSTPSRLHHAGSSACSASMNAATPPFCWAWATACRAIVVLPLDSGPNSSMIRPRGNPLPPKRQVQRQGPVEIPSTSMWDPSPSFMIAPAPNVFSIWLIALFSAFCSADALGLPSVAPCRFATALAPSDTSTDYVRNYSKLALMFGTTSRTDFRFFSHPGATRRSTL